MSRFKTIISRPKVRGALLILVISSLIQVYFFQSLHIPKLLLPLALYTGILTFCSPYFSALGVGLFEFLLLYINDTKTKLTHTPLSAIDIIEIKQATAISSYSDSIMTTLISLIIFCFIIGIWRQKKIFWKFAILPTILVLVFVLDYNRDQKQTRPLVQSALTSLGLRQHNFNWQKSVRRNGIFVHLIQTLDSLRIPQKEDHNFYQKFSTVKEGQAPSNPDIYVIMCESCFTTFDDTFETPLADLSKAGFQESIMISPQYGGGTADVEFEFLTGLPSINLRGIKYQLYGNRFHPKSLSLPSFLKNEGYHTVGLHNYFSFFWKRNSVYPLLGFNESFFIEDMGWEQKESWKPEDNYLYEKVLQNIEQQLHLPQSFFYFMVTMHGHGPYKNKNGDLGEEHYLKLMKETTDELLNFHDQIQKLSKTRKKNALIIVFGDHKPSLTDLFIKKGIFKENDSEASRKYIASQVPVYFKHIGFNNDINIQKELAQQINLKPVYCLPGVLLDLLKFNQHFFNSLKTACNQERSFLSDIDWLNDNFPLGLYGENLFSDTQAK